jgi:crossover junction endodeoxyribonuclease RusA
MTFQLPFPARILWPNGRGHHMAKHRENKKHKAWAFAAMKAELPASFKHDGTPLHIRAVFHPKTANAIDRDNASASLKAYQDGIAAALGVDDSTFGTPVIQFGAPRKGGAVIIEVEAV